MVAKRRLNNMKKYTVRYYFDGTGEVEIEANNKAEAEEKWRDGDCPEGEEWGQNYILDEVME